MRSSDISQHVSSLVLALEAWWALLGAAVVIRIPFGRQMILRRAMNTGAMTRSVPCFRGLSSVEMMPANPCEAAKACHTSTSVAIGEAVCQSARFHLKVMTCLEQSLATVWMHRRRGLPSRLEVGCRREGSQLFFHAWVPGPRILDLAAKEDFFGAFAPVSYQSIVPA